MTLRSIVQLRVVNALTTKPLIMFDHFTGLALFYNKLLEY